MQKFQLFEDIRSLITETQQHVARNINSAMVIAYFKIGQMIVENQQQGNQRADYAKETLIRLSTALNTEFGKGYSVSNLEYMRSFYLLYQHRISQSTIGKFNMTGFTLSWTHYIQLLKVKDDHERNFYEIEAAQNNWSVKELQRQYNSALYERLALSKDTQSVRQPAEKGQLISVDIPVHLTELYCKYLINSYVVELTGCRLKQSIFQMVVI